MKVLHVIPSVSSVHGGPSNAIALMEQVLSDAGVFVTTATTDDDGPGRRLPLSRLSAGGARRVYCRKWTEFYKISPSLFSWLLANVAKYDVVHIHALFSFSSTAAALAAKYRGIPYIVRPLGVLNAYGLNRRRPGMKALSLRVIEGPILTGAAAVHFTSRAEAEEAAAKSLAMRTVVIPLAVEPPTTVETCSVPFSVRPDERVIVFMSRIDPKKNVDGLIRAFSQLNRTHKDLRLVIAGSGSPMVEHALRRLAEAEGVAERVIWTGHVEGDAKWAALAAADVFALPSHSENFGIAAVEAMASGCPCVLGEGIAIAQEIADRGAALMTSAEPSDIAATLARLLDEPDLARSLGECARRMALSTYTPSAMAQSLIELYEDVISGGALRGQTDVLLAPTADIPNDRSSRQVIR